MDLQFSRVCCLTCRVFLEVEVLGLFFIKCHRLPGAVKCRNNNSVVFLLNVVTGSSRRAWTSWATGEPRSACKYQSVDHLLSGCSFSHSLCLSLRQPDCVFLIKHLSLPIFHYICVAFSLCLLALK